MSELDQRERAAKPRVVCFGSCFMDMIAYVPRIPGSGETLTSSSFQKGFGGSEEGEREGVRVSERVTNDTHTHTRTRTRSLAHSHTHTRTKGRERTKR